MAGYEIRIAARAAKELDGLARKADRAAVVRRIEVLAEDPPPAGCRKLSGVDDLYRIRQGPYRIVYAVEDGRLIVIVIGIADRQEVYRIDLQKARGGAHAPSPSVPLTVRCSRGSRTKRGRAGCYSLPPTKGANR